MEKNYLSHHFPTGKWQKQLFVTNLIIGLLLCVTARLYANDEPLQWQKLTVKYQSASILSILEDLKAKTGCTFVYKKNDIPEDT